MRNLDYKCLTSVLAILLCSCYGVSAIFAQEPTDEAPKDTRGVEISALLTAQTQAWNNGDLENFMSTYWKSDKLTFSSGGKTTHGWNATLENYRKNYAPPKDMGKLNFDHLDIRMIETNSALVLGQWHLQMKDQTNRDGNFSLVIKKLPSGWKIIHDHSSTLEPPKKVEIPNSKK